MIQDTVSLDTTSICPQRSTSEIIDELEHDPGSNHDRLTAGKRSVILSGTVHKTPSTSYHDELTQPLNPSEPATWDHVTVSRTRASWKGMKGRVLASFHRSDCYSERGIDADPRWLATFYIFASEVGPRPVGMTLDRIDNDQGYWPSNCRWASQETQRANRRTGSNTSLAISWRNKPHDTRPIEPFHTFNCSCGRECVVGPVSAQHRPFRCSECRGVAIRTPTPATAPAT